MVAVCWWPDKRYLFLPLGIAVASAVTFRMLLLGPGLTALATLAMAVFLCW